MVPESNKHLIIPPKYSRNAANVRARMEPDVAGEYLLRTMEALTGIDLGCADILDIGCGSRFAGSIVNRNIKVRSYTGIDVYKEMIDFLAENTAQHANMNFVHWPVENALYNPREKKRLTETPLPVLGSFDLICFFSVFTHLAPDDARAMLRLSAGALRAAGRIFLTTFVSENQETDFFDQEPSKPLTKATYRREYLELLIKEAGLAVVGFHPPANLMQHHYVLRHL